MLAWPVVVVDVICVLVFAIVGRRSHAESSDLVGVLRTAWPFLAGVGGGWLAARGWRQPVSLRTGVVIWVVTVAVG
ncbi:MAG: DUF3054 family protein, partial [Actinomycetes bacterium]